MFAWSFPVKDTFLGVAFNLGQDVPIVHFRVAPVQTYSIIIPDNN